MRRFATNERALAARMPAWTSRLRQFPAPRKQWFDCMLAPYIALGLTVLFLQSLVHVLLADYSFVCHALLV